MKCSLLLNEAIGLGRSGNCMQMRSSSPAVFSKMCGAGDASCDMSGGQQLPAGFQNMPAQHQVKEQHLHDWSPFLSAQQTPLCS